MNERSPVGIGRSLTGPSPETHSGQVTRATTPKLPVSSGLDGDVKVGGTPAEVGDASYVSVQPKIVRQPLGNRESVSEQNRGKLDLDLATTHRPNFSVSGTDIASKPDLHRTARFGPYSLVTLTGAGLNKLAKTFGESFLVTLDRQRQVAFVETIGEVEGSGVSPESQPVPDAHAIQIVELGAARSMFLKAREAHGSRERRPKPVETDQRQTVDLAGSIQPGTQHNTVRG